MDIRFVSGESYEVAVRGHRVMVDQPLDAGGKDTAPTPTELFAASLGTCVAFYAGRYLTRHGFSRDGLGVSVEFEMAADRPARVAGIHLTVRVPADLPTEKWPALRAVVSHCTVHNSLTTPPSIAIDLTRPTADHPRWAASARRLLRGGAESASLEVIRYSCGCAQSCRN